MLALLFPSSLTQHGIICAFSLGLGDSSCRDLFHSPPHRVLEAMEVLVFRNKLVQELVLSDVPGVLIAPPNSATHFVAPLTLKALDVIAVHTVPKGRRYAQSCQPR